MAGILALGFTLRAYKLLSMFPILVDESIYLRWAEIIDHQSQWFISLLDGKQPLTYWILALLRKISDVDPLLQGRLLSVFAGLLSTIGVFAIGRRLGGEAAGLLSAFLYACFPFALLFDRLAYTEAFVNLFGVAIVLTSLECFQESGQSWKRELPAGLALGLGLFTKQTVVLFAFFPALAGLWLGRKGTRSLWPRLAVIYGLASVFVLLSLLAVPKAPTLQTHDALLHHREFYVQPLELLRNPLAVAPANFTHLGSYISSYVTVPLALAALGSLIYWTARRSAAAWILLSVSIVPLLVQVFVLSLMFPTRWAFPHFWPWLVLVSMAAVDVLNRTAVKTEWSPARAVIGALAFAVFVGPMLARSVAMLGNPAEYLDPYDREGFLSSHAHAGFGNREAVDYLLEESRNGPFVLLTDPIWGPPSDTMFPYLNHRQGIRVYEAWWTQKSGNHPILPQGRAEIIKSHYEREKSGVIDFSKIARVFYVTDTNYYTRAAVHVRQPDARLVKSFPKPNQTDSIDVYRLK